MTALSTAYDDLAWLADHGAIDGVAEIMRQRRFQIEQGHTVEHDAAEHDDGALVQMAAGVLSALSDDRLEGLADPASDEMGMAQAGALSAAEIDRLNTDYVAEPVTYRCWRMPGEPGHTHHVHEPGKPCPLRLP